MSGVIDPVNPQIGYKGVFGRMKFPVKPFQAYPKMLQMGGGKTKIVNSLKEELDFRAEGGEVKGEASTQHPVESERDELAAQLTVAQQELRNRDERLASLEAQMVRMQALLDAPPAKVEALVPAQPPKK